MSADTTDKGRQKNPEEIREELGNFFSSLRKEKSYTREALSLKTKVPLKALLNLESGSKDFYKERLYARGFLTLLCRELKISDKDILNKASKCLEDSWVPSKTIIEQETLTGVKKLKTKTLFSFKSALFSLLILFGGAAFLVSKSLNYRLSQKSPNIVLQKKTLSQNIEKSCRSTIPKKYKNPELVSCLSLKVKEKTMITSSYDALTALESLYDKGLHHFYYTDTIDFSFEDATKVELIMKGKNRGPVSQREKQKNLRFSVGKESEKTFPSS